MNLQFKTSKTAIGVTLSLLAMGSNLGFVPVGAQTESGSDWVVVPGYGAYRALSPQEGPRDWNGAHLAFILQTDRIDQLQQGVAMVELLLPFHIQGVDPLAGVSLQMRESEPHVFYETLIREDAPWEERVIPSVVHRYTGTADSVAPLGNEFAATAVSTGGLVASGTTCPAIAPTALRASGADRYGFSLQSWEPTWALTSAPQEARTSVVFVGVHRDAGGCEDEDDQGGGGSSPPPPPPAPQPKAYKYAQMGEAKWCTENMASWKAQIDTMSVEITNGYSGTPASPGRVHDHCWIAQASTGTPDAKKAYECDKNGGCYDLALNTPYPYNGANRVCQSYLNGVKADIDHSTQAFPGFAYPSIGQVYHFHGTSPLDGVYKYGTCSSYGKDVCGLGEFSGKRSVARARAAPANENEQVNSGCKAYVPTHEMGHNFWLNDNAGDTFTCNGHTCGTVMMQSDQVDILRNTFTADNRFVMKHCVDDSGCGPNKGW